MFRCRAARIAIAFSAMIMLLASGCDALACGDASQRIVSLAPSVTETVFALSAGPRVVGVSRYCDFPPSVKTLPKIGTFLTPNVEAIVALQPTLIIGLESSANQRELRALKSIGFQLLLVRNDSLADITDGIVRIGERLGCAPEASELLDTIHAHFANVEHRLAGAPMRKVLMLVGHQPMVAVGSGTYLNELIGLAHGSNIAAATGQEWPRLGVEFAIAMAPEVIIDGQMGSDTAVPDSYWERYAEIPAVRDRRVSGFSEAPILHPGPRVWQSLEIIAAIIQPEVMKAPTGKSAGEL